MNFYKFTDEEYKEALEVLDSLLSKGIGEMFSCEEDELSEEVEQKILKTGDNSYYVVELVNDKGESELRFVHELVAATFVPNPNNYTNVRHKNGNTLDNRADNLEWII